LKYISKKFNRSHRNLPAIVAVGGSLAAFPVAALELGDVTVQSRLGQPLRASIAYALAPNEQISKSCVSLRPAGSASGLPGVGNATLSVSNGVIMLSGTSAMREPMVSAHVVVNCPYSPNLSREYMLFIDPATPNYEAVATTQQVTPAAEPVAVTPAVRQPQPRPAVRKDIGPAADYRVQPGDSLSAIAARIQNRPVGLWPAVNAIFAANPHAFMNNDPNQLKAGSVLSIPSFDGNAAIVAAEVFEPVAASSATATPSVTATPDVVVETPAVAEATPEPAVAPLTETSGDLLPGDVVVSDNPFVAPVAANENTVIPDTQLAGPTTNSTSPNVPTAIIRTSSAASDGTATPSWILWLAGSGIALIIGLLMFGRRFRGETDTAPLAPVVDAAPRRRSTDLETSDTENLETVGVDYDLTDESPTEENLALDADVVIGTGLEVNEDSSIEDFGFAAPSDVDIELPFEPVASDTGETDILSPMHAREQSILMEEVLPEDDDYDMSVIVDATKMPQPEEVTKRDLQAVVVEAEDETIMSGGYTIDKEIDYKVLEQDYEDELTATQALNKEIARAAAELTQQIETGADDNDETAALPLASVTELDITTEMPAQNDDDSSLDDTSVTEEITVNEAADDATVEMPQSSKAR
tara:strand:+ start:17835 stop:19760 length:1926 start_codon:yes stop_codon:yes gene_type:complete